MDEYLLGLLDYVSFDNIIIAFIIFLLTMFIKLPIKQATRFLEEEKRKGINSIILIIPIGLSIVLNIGYSLIFYDTWFSIEILKSVINSWLISVSIYAIYERIKIIIQALPDGKISRALLSDTRKYIKRELKQLLIIIQGYETLLEDTRKKITELNIAKNSSDLTTVFNANIEIQSLTELEKSLVEDLKLLQNKLTKLQTEELKDDISK